MPVETLSREQELHWIALKLVPGLGTRIASKLIAQFRSPQAIFRSSRSELQAAGISGALAQSITSGCTFEDAVVQQEKMLEIVTLSDPRDPPLLKEIFDPPIFIFARGRIDLRQSTMFVVGTRRPTPYGLAATERLSGDLARAGLTIASGMAGDRHRGTQGGSRCGGGNRRCFQLRRRCHLSLGQPRTRRGAGFQRADHFRVHHGLRRISAEFSHT